MKSEVQKLHRAGLSQREIAKELGIGRGKVRIVLSNLNIQEKALIINDLHIPFHDRRAIDLMLKVADQFKPDIVFINGDIGDFWAISSYVKISTLRDQAALKKELSQCRRFLRGLRDRFPNSKIVFIAGNHEYRWDCYIEEHARELVGLKGLSLKDQLELEELDIEWVYTGTRESSYLWGKLLIGHFNLASMHSGYTAKNLVDRKGISLIQGHCHRGGVHYKRIYNKVVVGYENFCLCDLNPPYVDRPNWQQGFSLAWKDTQSDLFHVQQLPILQSDGKYKVMYNGKVMEG